MKLVGCFLAATGIKDEFGVFPSQAHKTGKQSNDKKIFVKFIGISWILAKFQRDIPIKENAFILKKMLFWAIDNFLRVICDFPPDVLST